VPKVLAFKPNPNNDKQGFVRFDDNTEAWTPELAKIPDLIGKELPADWTLRDGPKGKQLLPPKVKGEGPRAAWANTEEGEKYVQERMDRRTALMQAVALLHDPPSGFGLAPVLELAIDMYAWLRESVSAPRTVPEPGTRQEGGTGSAPTQVGKQPAVGADTPVSEGPPLGASVSAAGVSARDGRDVQGPPSDTISDGEQTSSALASTGPSDERREGDAGDTAVKPEEAAQTPGSPSRRQRCLHTEGIRTVTKETGGDIDVCIKCGTVVRT
jgi:hypothetical protein